MLLLCFSLNACRPVNDIEAIEINVLILDCNCVICIFASSWRKKRNSLHLWCIVTHAMPTHATQKLKFHNKSHLAIEVLQQR